MARFLIDLPDDFEPAGDVELIYGLTKDYRKVKVEVPRSPEASRGFEATVKARKVELMAAQHSESPSKSMLALERRLDDRTILLRAYNSSLLVNSFKSELYRRLGEIFFLTTVRSYTEDQPDVMEASALAVVDRTVIVSDSGKTGRGTCLGPLLIDAGQDGEWFTVSFKSKRLPDVLIEFNSNSLLAESDGGLLSRRASKQPLLDKIGLRSDILRRGKITIAGRPGEELLERGRQHDKVMRLLTAEALLLKPATFAEPSFSISMTMGGQLKSGEYVDASMAEKDAVAMWDAIVKSIRVRPGAI
ncbi:MAG: hypothetical protein LH624_00725 [Cryobacterium sp.]|nr:hypothetical protein [Cryobacterium sp.]